MKQVWISFSFVVLLISAQLTACSNFLFVPIQHQFITPDILGILHEDIYLETEDGITLHGWKLIAAHNTAGTILFLHGNGDNVSSHFANAYWLVDEGYDVFLFDYREFGESEGEVSLDNAIFDVEKMIAYTVSQLPDDEKLIVLGHSLGGSLAIYAVANSQYQQDIKTLVTIEAFSDYHDITQDVLAKSWLFWLFQWPLSFTIDNSYRPLDSVAKISPVALLILHSRNDEMIDIYHAERLYEQAKQPKQFSLIDSGHNNIFVNPENRQVLLDYLDTLR